MNFVRQNSWPFVTHGDRFKEPIGSKIEQELYKVKQIIISKKNGKEANQKLLLVAMIDQGNEFIYL